MTVNLPKSDPHPRLRLAAARRARKWSQQEVAVAIGSTTLNVSRWERGLTKPGPYYRARLCELFGLNAQDLDLVADSTTSVGADAWYDPTIPLQPAIRLVGRDDELARLKQRLCLKGSIALTAINGLPGVGKTALAIALAHDDEIRAQFRDGILWAGLGSEPRLLGILSRWGALLGLSSSEVATLGDRDAWTSKLRQVIGSRAMLLVIDDAWHAEDVLTLKVGGPNCAYLVTTRFPNIAAAVATDGTVTVHELDEDTSVHLLRILAPGVVHREERKVRDIIRAVGGLPLALTLMGNYLRARGQGGQTHRIDSALQRLHHAEARLVLSEPQTPVEHHPSLSPEIPLSLQSVFAITVQQLDAQARTAFYSLSVFPPKPHSFSEEAALTVGRCTTDVLDTLFDSGLLESISPGRYALHQAIADYAGLRLEGVEPYERLVSYCTGFVEAHKKDYGRLEQESTQILAALETANTLRRLPELVRCACAFAPFLLLRGIYAVAEQHLQRAYDAALVLGDTYGITTALLYLGELAQYRGDFTQAETCYQEGLERARGAHDFERISVLLKDFGWLLWKRGEYTQSEAYLQEGLTLARQLEDQERMSSLLKVLGSVVAAQGDLEQSARYLQEGLALARRVGDQEQTSLILTNLGVTVGEQGNYLQAERYFQEGLALARQLGNRELMSVLLSNLGEAKASLGNYAQAVISFQEGLALARLGNRDWTSVLLANLGAIARKQGNYAQAEEYLLEALSLAQQLEIPQVTANTLYECGNLSLEMQQAQAADVRFREMLTVLSEGDRDLIALAQYGLARTAAAIGNIQEARGFAEESLTTLTMIGHRNATEVGDWLNQLPE